MRKVITTIEASLASSKHGCPQDPEILPFVEKVGRGKQKRLNYWNPKRAGDLFEDCVIGQYYATEALQFMEHHKNIDILRLIAMDMAKMKRQGMLETTFWRTIQTFTIKGIAS